MCVASNALTEKSSHYEGKPKLCSDFTSSCIEMAFTDWLDKVSDEVELSHDE